MKTYLNQYFIYFGFFFFLINFFLSNQEAYAQDGQIDYEKLNTIETRLATEIGSSTGYLSGQLRDLVLMSEGIILVSDIGKNTIEQFHKEGLHESTIAREGRGPGELPFMFSLSAVSLDLLIVHHNSSRQIDLWSIGEDGLYKYDRSYMIDPGSKHTFFTVAGARSEKEYYAIKSTTTVDLHHGEYKMNHVVLMDEFEKVIEDSLHSLKEANYLYADPKKYSTGLTFGGLTPVGLPPYRYEDRFIQLDNDHYMIARPDSSGLYIYNADHEIDRYISLNVKERSVKKSDLDYHLRNEDREAFRRLETHVSDYKPPFLNIWVSKNYLLLHTDSNEDGKEMVLLTMEGIPVGKFYLLEFDEVEVFNDNNIYTIYKNPGKGDSIKIEVVWVYRTAF